MIRSLRLIVLVTAVVLCAVGAATAGRAAPTVSATLAPTGTASISQGKPFSFTASGTNGGVSNSIIDLNYGYGGTVGLDSFRLGSHNTLQQTSAISH